MSIFSLEQLVALAKFASPLYRDLYRDVVPHTQFTDLPILSNDVLTRIVHGQRPDFIFDDGYMHGIVFESSASTGKPKVTLFGRDEWETSTRLLSAYHWRNGLIRDGDRLANVCASAYISYRLVHSVVERFPGRCSEIPIGCDRPYDELNDVIQKYESNVLAGINSTILGLAIDLLSRDRRNEKIVRILAGGELLYGAQRHLIQQAFPQATMVSFMFGTTESGVIGYSHLDDAPDTFRALVGASIVEIVDERSEQPIDAAGQRGKCVVTSLLRVAAPAIRVDTGDYAVWLDELTDREPRRFRLLGRKFPFARALGNARFNETDVWVLIQSLRSDVPLIKLQLEIHADRVEIVYALADSSPSSRAHAERGLSEAGTLCLAALHDARIPIAYRHVEFCHFMESTRRKGRFIIDCRPFSLDSEPKCRFR